MKRVIVLLGPFFSGVYDIPDCGTSIKLFIGAHVGARIVVENAGSVVGHRTPAVLHPNVSQELGPNCSLKAELGLNQ